MSRLFALFKSLWAFIFGFFPPWFAVCLIVLIGFMVVIIVCKIVAFILDMIPFA